MAAKKTAKKTVAKRKTGRPTKYSKALAARLCAQLAQGKSVRTVCKMASMPSCSTVFLWLANNKAFSEQYEKAVESRADAMIEDMLEFADDTTENPQRSRLQIDTRKWIASKLKARKYGDKLEVSGDPDRPMITKIQRELV